MSAVSDRILCIEFTNSDIWDNYRLVSSGGKIDETGSDASFFKKITLNIPETYLSSDKEAKIKEIITTITKFNRDLLTHQMNEKKFLLSKPAEGNSKDKDELVSYIRHISIYLEALLQMKEFSKNGITYKLEY